MSRRTPRRRCHSAALFGGLLTVAMCRSAIAAEPWPELRELYGAEMTAVSETLTGLFGDEIARAEKTESTSDDAALARRFALMAERSVDSKPLLALAAQHAFIYGVRDPKGFDAADKAMSLLIQSTPESSRGAWEGRRLELRLLQLDGADEARRGEIAAELVRNLDAWAGRQTVAGEWTQAAATYGKAHELAARFRLPDAETMLSKQHDAMKRALSIAQAQARAKAEAEQMAREKAEQESRRAAEERRDRLRRAIVELDDPRAALDVAREIGDERAIARLTLAAEPVDEVEPADAATLGQWYLDLAAEADADDRTRMMIRAWRYFDRFLDEHAERDQQRAQIVFTLDALTKDLGEAGIDPMELARLERPRRVALESRVNTLGMKLVLAPAGRFSMGSPEREAGRRGVELPHNVELTADFYIGATEVTQAQWRKVMGSNPSKNIGDDLPVDSVTWADAAEFCRRLSTTEGRTYRLPTEAEWEYACRAGTTGRFADNSYYPDAVAWYARNADGKSRPAATRAPNAWGLFDMHGNVAEWCLDYADAYSAERAVDPLGPAKGDDRIVRGGSWQSDPESLRSAARTKVEPTRRSASIGFRVVCQVAPDEPDESDAEPTPDPASEPARAPGPVDSNPAVPAKQPSFFGIPTGR